MKMGLAWKAALNRASLSRNCASLALQLRFSLFSAR
jgi:hypothetical protein